MTGCTDTLSVPILKDEITDIWKEQKRHVRCIQYPAGFRLYAKVDELTKGGLCLPVYRCPRGSTTVESLHHHLLNFIPATSANSVHLQAYLLDGICRWNALRKDCLIGYPIKSVRTFDLELMDKFNQLHAEIHGANFNNQVLPNKHSSEAFGLEYLFSQSNLAFSEEYVRDNVDDGSSSDKEDGYDSVVSELYNPVEEDSVIEEEDNGIEQEEKTSIDAKGIPGWVDQSRSFSNSFN